jgi:hypothetical protein
MIDMIEKLEDDKEYLVSVLETLESELPIFEYSTTRRMIQEALTHVK